MNKIWLYFGFKSGLLTAIREHPEHAQSILVFGGVAICLWGIIAFVGVHRFVAFWLRLLSWFLVGTVIVHNLWVFSLVIFLNLMFFANILLTLLSLPRFYLFGFF